MTDYPTRLTDAEHKHAEWMSGYRRVERSWSRTKITTYRPILTTFSDVMAARAG
jgi:hypothetical protein